MPNKKMMKRYADTLLGSSSRGARLALDAIPRAHELALVIRNIAELSALSGHSLRRSLRMDVTRKKDRKEIRRLKAEVKLKVDVVQVTKEHQMVEVENEKLKAELKKEKEKEKRSRERIVMLHNDLLDKSLKNDRLNIELNETYQKLTKDRIALPFYYTGIKALPFYYTGIKALPFYYTGIRALPFCYTGIKVLPFYYTGIRA
ncbi:hypothetical protein Dimus_020195 [Dionaea muscipula]